jgi:hypothetical protein
MDLRTEYSMNEYSCPCDRCVRSVSPEPFMMAGDYLSAPLYYDDVHNMSLTPPRTPERSEYLFPHDDLYDSYSIYPPTPPMEYALPYSSVSPSISYAEYNGQSWGQYAENKYEKRNINEYSTIGYPSSQYVDRYIDSRHQFKQI